MHLSRAVVLEIDRLGAGWLAPYGNTWLDAPSFNRLAAQSLLIETAISDSPELAMHARSVWTGLHAMVRGAASESLPTRASAAGGASRLLTDDSEIFEHALAGHFADRRLIEPLSAMESAEEIEATGLFRFFEHARAALDAFAGPGLLWLHASGMSGAWDAPLELRYQFADELDPDPPTFVEPPQEWLPQQHDPDALLGIVQAYAGQVALADMCLGPWLDAFEAHPLASETLLVVTAPRGYPLGEHRRIGPCDHALYGELLHVPLFLRFPGQEAARLQRIMQPAELCGHIADACGWSAQAGGESPVEALLAKPAVNVAYSIAENQRAIRTRAWFLRESVQEGVAQQELFAKPDDRWEANEIASRCGDIVELLAAELDRFAAAAAEGRTEYPESLPEPLYDQWR